MKKLYLIPIFGIFSAFMLGGCANNNKTDAVEMNTQTDDVVDNDTNNSVANLTDDVSTSVGIDYDIKSYDSVKDFSYKLFSENMDCRNPVLSPVSAYLALSMAGFGANGDTRTEFLEVLGDDMMALSDDMMNVLPVSSDNNIISIANSAWLDNDFKANDEWFGKINSFLDAEAFQTDLASADSVNSINNWIDKSTNGLIKQMLSEPLGNDARLALINSIYFKAKWQSPFEIYKTYEEDFTLEDSSVVQAEMLHKKEDMTYISNTFAEGLIFPYLKENEDDGSLAFVALKSKESSSIRDVYSKLTDEVIADLLINKQTKLVNTKLPKFDITFDIKLNDSLKNMGLTDAFDAENADLTLLGNSGDGNNLYINLVKQKAKVIVDEEGTEAAAATIVAVAEGAAFEEPEETLDVFFDEPFIYMIMDMDKEIPLFIGIIDNPAVY